MNLKSKLPSLQENISLASQTTFRIGGPAKYFFVAQSSEDFISAIRAAKETGEPFYVLGGGSNLLVADEGFDGLVVKNQISKIKYQKEGGTLKIICDTGVPLTKIILETTHQGYSGAEWGWGIPGTIGGAIFSNAGRLGQDISQVVESVSVLDSNLNEKEISGAQCEFAYRESKFKKTGEIILEATLIFKKEKQELIDETLNQAKAVVKKSPPFPSAGCVFKNYEVTGADAPGGADSDLLLQNHPELASQVRGNKIGVGYLIDQCGLKGRRIGGAQVWEGHANYIVNVGGAKAADVSALIAISKQAIKEKFGIELEEEIRYLI